MSVRFRREALDKLTAAAKSGEPVRLARLPVWAVLAICALLVGAGCVWAVGGSLPQTVSGPGLLTYPAGSYVVYSTLTGEISAVLVYPGQTLTANVIVMEVTANGQSGVVRAVAAGRVGDVLVAVGQYVTPGTPLATVDRTEPDADRSSTGTPRTDGLVAVLYLPISDEAGTTGGAQQLWIGAAVDLAVQSVPAGQFGVLKGRVASVGQAPQTPAQVRQFLGDQELTDRFTAGGPTMKVVVELLTSDSTASGFAWSTGQGPPYHIKSHTLLDGTIRTSTIRPIEWLFPR